jgi:hypothetical protein
MIYGRFRNDIKLKEMSFESCYYSGSMIGGAKELSPVIHLKGGKVITDIGVGFQTYTMWAGEENQFRAGETVAECTARHNVAASDVEKIVVSSVDTTRVGKVIHETFVWTPQEGWKQDSYEER